MLKRIAVAVMVVMIGSSAYAGSGACQGWDEPSVLAENALDGVLEMIAEDATDQA